MAIKRKSEAQASQTRRPPATTPEGREKQLISLAVDLVEQRLRNGTATSQEVTHFLKLGSSRESLEQERLAKENELLRAKTEAIESAARVEALYTTALDAMRSYAGLEPTETRNNYDD